MIPIFSDKSYVHCAVFFIEYGSNGARNDDADLWYSRHSLFPPYRSIGHERCSVKYTIALFKPDETPRSEEKSFPIDDWAPNVREHLLTIVHFVSFLVSGFSAPGQDLMWITDEDVIAPSDYRLKSLTKLFGDICSHYLSHDLGHMRCGTTRSDTGKRDLEDICAIPDLVAGAASEALTKIDAENLMPSGKIIMPISGKISWKTKLIVGWYAKYDSRLLRGTYVIEKFETKPHLRAKSILFHAVPNQ